MSVSRGAGEQGCRGAMSVMVMVLIFIKEQRCRGVAPFNYSVAYNHLIA